MAELETGALVAGRYVVVSLLGAGGMGAVYRARDTETETLCAIKVLREARGDLATRFLREARIASALAHPNIARVHEVLELDDGTPAIVMELLSGESLGARLARAGKLAPAAIARVGLGVAAAIEAAHERGVVHRDLKPDNVFLCDDGAVKVLDFGIAKVTFDAADPAITAAALTETGQLLGTPQYMAPEQIFGEKDVDARADVWAFGVILYQALAGVRPFDGANPGQIFKAIALDPPVPLAERAPHAPPELVDLVGEMLVHARADRLADLGRVTRVLERIAASDLGEADTLHASEPLARARPRSTHARRRGAVVAGFASVAAIGAAAFVAWRSPARVLAPPAASASPIAIASAAGARLADDPSPSATSSPAASSPAEPAASTEPAAAAEPAASAPPTHVTRPPPATPTDAGASRARTAPEPAASAAPAASASARTNRSGSLKRDEF